MPGVGFRRLVWIGAAALLVVAALISDFALLRGELTPTDGNILFSLAAAFLAGSAALSGTSERVVGRGPGRVEVELADGETLVRSR